jgi:hypothetical protein
VWCDLEKQIQTEFGPINCSIIREERRSIALRFSENKSLFVLVPKNSGVNIDSLLTEHIGWIKKHYAQMLSSKRLFDGDRVMHRGRYYRLEIREAQRSAVALSADTMVVSAENQKRAMNVISRFLLHDTMEAVTPLVHEKATRVNRNVSGIRFRRMKRWGSCDANRRITINAYLSMLPIEIADYVVSHEVAHLVEMNHSKDFWGLVSGLCPNYRELRKELRAYSI